MITSMIARNDRPCHSDYSITISLFIKYDYRTKTKIGSCCCNFWPVANHLSLAKTIYPNAILKHSLKMVKRGPNFSERIVCVVCVQCTLCIFDVWQCPYDLFGSQICLSHSKKPRPNLFWASILRNLLFTITQFVEHSTNHFCRPSAWTLLWRPIFGLLFVLIYQTILDSCMIHNSRN